MRMWSQKHKGKEEEDDVICSHCLIVVILVFQTEGQMVCHTVKMNALYLIKKIVATDYKQYY